MFYAVTRFSFSAAFGYMKQTQPVSIKKKKETCTIVFFLDYILAWDIMCLG